MRWGASPWSDEDLVTLVKHWVGQANAKVVASPEGHCEAILAALAPRVTELQQEAWDKGLHAGQESERRDPAFYSESWIRNPYRVSDDD